MNLLTSSWVPMRLRDGSIKSLPVKYLADPDVVDLAFPRADFQGAAYQLLIGLLQTTYAPDDTDAWVELFELPPTLDKLEATFCAVKHAFNVSGDGALFMQDLDLLEETKSTTVSGLLIEAPGGNALKLNTDHFVKRGVGKCMSLEMAVMALFTLQINAPTGGQGHRTGLRGGGPLTTLIMSKNTAASLWEKLWLNVINREHWQYDDPDFHSGELFPWLVPTKTSESKNSEVYAEDVHPLHMFWATPRRIRLLPEEGEARCDISGELSTLFVTAYKTKNYGCNYSGTWSHPLTPYGYNPKKPDEDHLSVKGQSGGVTYKIWDLLTLQSKEEGQIPAKVISHLSELLEEFDDLEEQIRLWVFAYDMDNMKACGFYSVEMPFFNVPDAKRVRFFLEVKRLQKLSSEILWSCNSNIKEAWFKRPADAKGKTGFIDLEFWQRSESVFFSAVSQLVESAHNGDGVLSGQQASDWLRKMKRIAADLFDEKVLSEFYADSAMHKKIAARRKLSGWMYGSKPIKAFRHAHSIDELEKEIANG